MPLLVRAAILVFAMIGSLRADDGARPDLSDLQIVAAGHQLFLEKHCSHCHGTNGDGGVNLTNRDLTDAKSVFEAIAEGQESGAIRMPAWRGVLSDAEIWQVAAYVMSLGRAAK